MCGIVGCRQGTGQPASRPRVSDVLPLLRHRGPDQHDLVEVADLIVGHTRLSIIDPNGCRQPVILGQPGDRWVLAFNGEILNFRDLQGGLHLPDGAEHSDTLTLAALLHRDGLCVIPKLRGQFAFVWWSERTGILSLVRDSLGIVPLYYAVSSDGRVSFASEIAAIDALVGFTADVDPHSAAPTWPTDVSTHPRRCLRTRDRSRPARQSRSTAQARAPGACHCRGSLSPRGQQQRPRLSTQSAVHSTSPLTGPSSPTYLWGFC